MLSDSRLRELERAFQESGSEESELDWLRERARLGQSLDWRSYSRLHELDVEAAVGYLGWRVQVGDLSQERLELAAHYGHPASLRIFPSPSLQLPQREAHRLVFGLLNATAHLWNPSRNAPPATARLTVISEWIVNPNPQSAEACLPHTARKPDAGFSSDNPLVRTAFFIDSGIAFLASACWRGESQGLADPRVRSNLLHACERVSYLASDNEEAANGVWRFLLGC